MGYTRRQLIALQAGAIVDELHRSLAGRARENFQKFRIDGHGRTIARADAPGPGTVLISRMPRLLLAALVLSCSIPALAQPPGRAGTASADAYLQFMLARQLEAQGDAAGALEALKRAESLAPDSAEVMAEMASMYARQNKATDAHRRRRTRAEDRSEERRSESVAGPPVCGME